MTQQHDPPSRPAELTRPAAAPNSPGPPAGAGRGLLERTVLDTQVADRLHRHGRWPWAVAVGPTGVLVALIVIANIGARRRAGTASETVASLSVAIAGELLLLAAVLLFGRAVAAGQTSFAAALGLDWVRGRDWLPWITGLGIVFVARIAVGILAAAFSNGHAGAQASNVPLHTVNSAIVTLLVLLVVVIAPLTEELMFRGLMLRALMQRLRFWPAALLSTAVFAGLHAYEVRTLAGALTLVASVGVLGLANCYLVRITGRLTPAIMVHASFNLLAVLVALARAR